MQYKQTIYKKKHNFCCVVVSVCLTQLIWVENAILWFVVSKDHKQQLNDQTNTMLYIKCVFCKFIDIVLVVLQVRWRWSLWNLPSSPPLTCERRHAHTPQGLQTWTHKHANINHQKNSKQLDNFTIEWEKITQCLVCDFCSFDRIN